VAVVVVVVLLPQVQTVAVAVRVDTFVPCQAKHQGLIHRRPHRNTLLAAPQ
jgi:hypothetical protein